jgi:hypothetical protein
LLRREFSLIDPLVTKEMWPHFFQDLQEQHGLA